MYHKSDKDKVILLYHYRCHKGSDNTVRKAITLNYKI